MEYFGYGFVGAMAVTTLILALKLLSDKITEWKERWRNRHRV